MTPEANEPVAGGASIDGATPVESPLATHEIKRRASRGAVLLAGRGVAIRGVGFLGTLVLARLLLPEDFGLIAFGLTLWTVGSFLQDGGLGAHLIRREEAPNRSDLRALVGVQLGVTLAVCALVAVIALPMGRGGAVTAVMVFSLPLLALRTPNVIVLERELAYGRIAVVELTEVVVYNAVAIALVAAGLGVWGVAIAFVVRALAGTLLMVVLGPVGSVLPSLDFARVRSWLSFGVQYQSVSIVHLIRDQGLNVGVAAVGGLRVLGVYTLTVRLLQVLSLLFESLWRVSYPAMAQLLRNGEDAGPAVARMASLTALGTGLAVVALAGAAPALIPALFGDEWLDVLEILPWAAAGLMIAGPVSVACAGFLFAAGSARSVLLGAVWHTAAALLIALSLLPVIGPTALGLALLAASLVETVALGSATVRRSSWRPLRDLLAPTLAAGVAGAAGWLLASTGEPTLWRAAVAILVAEALFMLAVLLVQRRAALDLLGVVRAALARSSRG